SDPSAQRSPRHAERVASPNYVSHSARGSRGRQSTGLGLARSLLGVVVRSTRAGVPKGSVPAFVCLRARAAVVSEAAGWVNTPRQGRAPPSGRRLRPPPPRVLKYSPWKNHTKRKGQAHRSVSLPGSSHSRPSWEGAAAKLCTEQPQEHQTVFTAETEKQADAALHSNED
ncbi:hypothetical protein Celaphus_00008415, partial [Cervus elaphus hippelaphus]